MCLFVCFSTLKLSLHSPLFLLILLHLWRSSACFLKLLFFLSLVFGSFISMCLVYFCDLFGVHNSSWICELMFFINLGGRKLSLLMLLLSLFSLLFSVFQINTCFRTFNCGPYAPNDYLCTSLLFLFALAYVFS